MQQWKPPKVVLLGLLVISDGAEANWGVDNCANPHPTNSCIHMEVKQDWRDCNEINRAPTGAKSAEPCTTALPHWGFVSGHVVGNLWLGSNWIKSRFPLRIMMYWFQLYDEHKNNHHLDHYLEKKKNLFCLFVWLNKIWNVMFSFAWAHVGVNHAIAYPWLSSLVIDSTVRYLYVHLWLIVYLHSLHSGRLICMCMCMWDIL